MLLEGVIKLNNQSHLNKYKGISVTLVDTNGNRFVVNKPLSKSAVEKQLREHRNEYGSYVIDYIRGKEASYEQFGDTVSLTFRVWEPGGSYSKSRNAYTKTIEVEKKSIARQKVIEFILNDTN
mgnify:CR=1 FL=1